MMARFILFVLLLMCQRGYADPVRYAIIAVLDKVTTKVQIFYLKVGEEVNVRDRMKVRVCACDAPQEASFYQDHKKCFVEVFDYGIKKEDMKRVFAQWMFRDYPVIGAVEHIRYDVWVLDCMASEPKERQALL